MDHVVIAVADLESAVADFTALGFTILPGGEHVGGVTRNALIVFQDGAYIELIAFKKADPSMRWSIVYDRAGEGFLDFAVCPTDIDAEVAAAREHGLDIALPVPGGRTRPDGERVAWKVARPAQADLPFFCGDVTPRRLRVQDGDMRRHPNGALGIAELTLAVADRERSLERYRALLGSGAVEKDGIRIGATLITLVGPDGGVAAASLDVRGEGPIAMAFCAADGRTGNLDVTRTHGSALSWFG